MTLADLQQKQDELAAVKAEIAAEEEKFNAAVARLRERQRELEAELANGLRAELASLGSATDQKPLRHGRPRSVLDERRIVDVVRKAPDEISAGQIYEAIGGANLGISPASLSQKLRSMVEDGQLVRHGEKRGTRYRVPG